MDDSGDKETKSDKDNYEYCAFLDVMKVAYELSGPFAEVGAPQADNGSSNPPGNFHKNFSLDKSFH